MDINTYLSDSRKLVNERLDVLLPPESEEPTVIHKAMRHSVFAGGKRVRPILILASGESLSGDRDVLLHLGAGIEMMHTYSLIHDDLPALDNDDLRRGVPTCHKVFGEALAILAGDALMTRCYQVLTDLLDLECFCPFAQHGNLSFEAACRDHWAVRTDNELNIWERRA